ncbi:MAG: alpha-2-macroglobulin [Prevotella sp.]|nr:alpha-2-macroglobulin [Prevotella sp.]
MKKLLICAIIALLTPMMMNAQTYSSLWKQVKEAEQNELPQTEQQVLTQIADKARKEQAYGHLLKAELQRARSVCSVSPDSLKPEVERLKQRAEQVEGDIPLLAVYHYVLGYIYENNRWLDEDRYKEIAKEYYAKAIAHPAELAAVRATDYDPFVIKGVDSRYFGDDLLSLIGQYTDHWDVVRDYHQQAGNRRGTLLATSFLLIDEQPRRGIEPLNKSKHIQRLDSLINEYQDLVECGEVAIDRFDFMDERTDATPEQKWQYINMALERWGAWQGMNSLRNAQRRLTQSRFEAKVTEKVTIPQHSQEIKFTDLRNITELTLRVYKANVKGDIRLNPENTEDYKKLKPLLTALPELTQTRHYVGKRPYELFEDSIELGGLPVGVYLLEMESLPATQTARCFYFVSDVRLLTQTLPDNKVRLVAVNATSGQPVKGATVTVQQVYGRNMKTTDITCNEQGEYLYTYDHSQRLGFRVHTPGDQACPPHDEWNRFFLNERTPASESIDIYTDRAIYRPGQTVHCAAIVYSTENGRDHTAMKNKEVNFELRDANYKVVSEQRAVTDEFGTAVTQFTLPTQGLTGSFSIRVNDNSHDFRVEEYKRPAFEVDIPRVAENYEDGDTVVARGTARSYAGVPIQGATVKYKVVRTRAFWWLSYSRYYESFSIGTGQNDEVMAEGETVTDEKGVFTVDMPMVLPKTKYPMFYNFVLTADVTDQAGETHQGTMSLPLGNRKTAFSVTLPEKVLSEGDVKMAFHQQNAAGVDLDATVRYRFDNSGRWQEVKTNKLIDIPLLKSGEHTLNAICETDTLEQEFVVFSLEDTHPVTDTRSWFYASRDQFPMSGDPVTVQAGTSDKQVHVVYTVISGKEVLESGTVDISNELINRKFQYKKEYGNGVLITYAWMKEGKYYSWNTTIRRPMPDMHLDVKWKTFRNRLTPGQQEEWTLVVTKPDGTPANAQFMATLYDKSLDQLTPHIWNLMPSTWMPLPSTLWMCQTFGEDHLYGEKNFQWLNVPQLDFNRFDFDIFPSYRYGMRMKLREHGRGLGALNDEAPMMLQEVVLVKQSASADEALQGRIAGMDIKSSSQAMTGADDAIAEGAGEQKQAAVQMRENLQETAFFMPQLLCDSTGQLTMKFTLPESLTTWRFLGVAHTKDMMYGQMDDEAVARKEVMIQPNMPRFLRQGDEGAISARIMNMSDAPISGTATLQLLDPETERIVLEQRQQVTVEDSSTIAVTFPVNGLQLMEQCSALSVQCSMFIARVSISTPTHSDGEQHYLPLLPNTERVTVTVPFTQTAPGTKTIDLTDIIPESAANSTLYTLHSKLTVEYTNNPAWLMIQALPTVGHPHDDCAICQATSLYANTIGRHILQQNPSAKNVFEQWKREEQKADTEANSSRSSLHSSLQKNQELKDLLLNETPWVMDADREQEQKQRLADFFEPNTIDTRLSSAIENLNKLQNSDGSWSWWPGMDGSAYITIAVAEMMVRLNGMTSQQNDTQEMLGKAFGYLGDDIVELVNEMKKEEKKGIKQTFPSFRALQWLYICALDGRDLPRKVVEANDYLKNLLKKELKSQTIYEKALSAIILDNKSYIKSLKEWTVYKEDMGRYYDTQRAGYSWRDYKIPTQVATIEAIKRLTPQDTVTIVEMQRWLLQEKRNQAWDTPLNSVDAIYAFLNGNSQALAPQPKTVLRIDGKQLDTSDATAGIGYVKTTIPLNNNRLSTFSAEKTSAGTSWGAVYAQFMQPARDIADQQSGISVKREIFSGERRTESEKSATANNTSDKRTAEANSTLYTQNSKLHVGSRVIVRITIEADRDYDFVQVQDKRAACMEPLKQLSGYNWRGGYYCAPKDYTTNYFFDRLSKGRHIIETEYYIDREGTYETGSCTAQCAYSPEFRGTTKSVTLHCVQTNDK